MKRFAREATNMADTNMGWNVGKRIAPPRFLTFAFLALASAPVTISSFGWRLGVMSAFDIAALAFLISCYSLFGHGDADNMRAASRRNDANRLVLLALTSVVMMVILVAVASELTQKGSPHVTTIALVLGTLALSWVFSNLIYALHYAHLFYLGGKDGKDCGGIGFPDTEEPTYWDFVYFSFTLGMTFQTSDTEIQTMPLRRLVTFHCLAAFVFNIGVIAFTINVLGSAGG
jgi:uncharacterized membrane protein